MKKVKVITSSQAAELVKDNDTITSIGFVSCAHPEALTKALEKRFLETGSPKNLTYRVIEAYYYRSLPNGAGNRQVGRRKQNRSV